MFILVHNAVMTVFTTALLVFGAVVFISGYFQSTKSILKR